MIEKCLGKITSAEFGMVKDHPYLVGLQLRFSMNGSSVEDGGKYTENLSSACKWPEPIDRVIAITQMVETVNTILRDARVNYVSELVGTPVEVTLDGHCFKDFRILTEVL